MGFGVVCFIIFSCQLKGMVFNLFFVFVKDLGLQEGPVSAAAISNLFFYVLFQLNIFTCLWFQCYSKSVKGQVVFQRAWTPTYLFWTLLDTCGRSSVFEQFPNLALFQLELCLPCECLGWGTRKEDLMFAARYAFGICYIILRDLLIYIRWVS